MSAIYNLEPPTKGKVVIKTTLGDIDIELWAKEAPKAVRNFVQLCLEGYYNGTVFHRVVKDFMIQGGDPTGTGKGGESIYGAHFRDEIHSRLRFSHRGIVACANENEPHTNGSQFFITLEACPHLDKKHTIFGKVVGDSIYNVTHFNDLYTGEDDRPSEPPVLLDAEVLWNPFEDLVPRITKEERLAEEAARREREADELKRDKKKRKKNLVLLSFGEEAGEEDAEVAALAAATQIRSAFDAVIDDDPRLVKSGTELADRLAAQEAAEDAERRRLKASVRAVLAKKEDNEPEAEEDRATSGRLASTSDAGDADADAEFGAKMRAQALANRRGQPPPAASVQQAGLAGEETAKQPKSRVMRDRQQEAVAAGRIKPARMKPSKLLAKQDTSLMSQFERGRLEAKERSRLAKEKGNNMAKLLEFKKRLASQPAADTAAHSSGMVEEEKLDAGKGYDGKPTEGPDMNLPAAWRVDNFLDDYEDEKLDSLVTHKLEFVKDNKARDAMATDYDDHYAVVDPVADRNETWNQKDGAAKRRTREWGANHERPVD